MSTSRVSQPSSGSSVGQARGFRAHLEQAEEQLKRVVRVGLARASLDLLLDLLLALLPVTVVGEREARGQPRKDVNTKPVERRRITRTS